MIIYCPYCGHNLSQFVKNGITSCNNCSRVFDSSPFHRLLSAAWMTRKRHYCCPDSLIQQGFTPEESELVIKYIYDECYDHQQFIELIQSKNVA